jgi:tRNA(Ile)-lysidine synthase
LRNRIRNELLPLLQKKYQPGLAKTVLRLMEITGAEAEFASETAQAWLDNKSGKRKAESGKPARGVARSFDRLPVAVQRKVLQQQLTAVGVISDFDLIEQLRAAPGKFVSIRSGLAVAREAAGKISRRELLEKSFKAGELELQFQGRAGRAEFAGRKFRWQIQPLKEFRLPVKKNGVEFFDVDKIGGEIVLRHWRAGDRFQPSGMKSAVKLQDLFVNAKLPAARRRHLILATAADGEIFWVEGLRIGERFKLSPETGCQLIWNWSKLAA